MVLESDPDDLPDRADFDRAIADRGDRWYSACLRITRDPDLAADAVQDALLSAWTKRKQFQRTARLDTWIHRIAVNAALQLLRKQRPERFAALDEEIVDQSLMPDQVNSDHELEDSLSLALGSLSDIERVCFVLKHLEQWKLAEIASEIDANVGVVKQALFRGVRKLRPRMAALKETANG